jgi:hypothetical protein
VIVCLNPPQMNDFCDLLGTPYAPVSKIAPVKVHKLMLLKGGPPILLHNLMFLRGGFPYLCSVS